MSKIETFANPHPGRKYKVAIRCPEFTSLCPRTGQPDFGIIYIAYIPGESCIELKSLKLYMFGYRNEGIFYEDVTNKILDDLVSACKPVWVRVTGRFNVRGGLYTTVVASWGSESNPEIVRHGGQPSDCE